MRRFIVEYDVLRGEEIVFHGKTLVVAERAFDARAIQLVRLLDLPWPEDYDQRITSVVEWQVEA